MTVNRRRIFSVVAMAMLSSVMVSSPRLTYANSDSVSGTQKVDEAKFVTIGGIEQWITIKGADRRNPVLLMLHGGPAEVQSPLTSVYQSWEESFVVVQWDQRGAGKTFAKNGKDTPDMTLAKMTQDVIELADYLRSNFNNKKIVLVGHSWGAFLGVHAIKQRPDLFAVFVGTGQPESWDRTVAVQYEYVLASARANQDQTVLSELGQVGAPPYKDLGQYMRVRRALNKYMPASDLVWFGKQQELYGAALSPAEAQSFKAAGQFSLAALSQVLFAMDLPALGTKFDVPFVVIQGSDDHIAPTKAAKEYFDSVSAPSKQFLLIEHAGHFAAMTHSQEFLSLLKQYVLPLVRNP